MAKSKKNHAPEQLEAVENVLSRSEQFIEDNQKLLSNIVMVILIIVAAFLGVKRFYIKPLNEEASTQMYVAEQYFEADSFNLAMMGDGTNFGFIDIIDEYGITKSGNLAKYYAGISYLHLGDYEEAIKYLKKFKKKDMLTGAIAYGAIGDAYWELDETEKAISYYNKAANYKKNNFTSAIYLLKAGYAYESIDDYTNALKAYKNIKENYKESTEARNIDKNITKVELLLKQ